jgi:RNA polymerase nonessential primary-like sigma factor
VLRELNLYLSTARELTKKQSHEPTYHEIAKELDTSIDEVKKMMELNEHIISLDMQLTTDNMIGKPLIEGLADKSADDPVTLITDLDRHENLEICLRELDEKQREVLSRRFGLYGYERQTLEEVGKAIGLTRERVRQIQMNALKILRDILKKHGLDAEVL